MGWPRTMRRAGDLYYDLARSIVDGVESVPGSLDDIWSKVREQETEMLGLPPVEEMTPLEQREETHVLNREEHMDPESSGPILSNAPYDLLWKKMIEHKGQKRSKKRIDEKQLFLFQ